MSGRVIFVFFFSHDFTTHFDLRADQTARNAPRPILDRTSSISHPVPKILPVHTTSTLLQGASYVVLEFITDSRRGPFSPTGVRGKSRHCFGSIRLDLRQRLTARCIKRLVLFITRLTLRCVQRLFASRSYCLKQGRWTFFGSSAKFFQSRV